MRAEITGIEDLVALAADFDDAAKVAPEEARQVVARGALNIKKDAQKATKGIAHAPLYWSTITYDTHVTPTGVEGEVGADADKQVGGGPHRTPGNLASVLEFGSVNNAPIPHLGPAAEAERPRFERAAEDLLAKTLDRRR